PRRLRDPGLGRHPAARIAFRRARGRRQARGRGPPLRGGPRAAAQEALMVDTNRQVRLASRPAGWVTQDNFSLTEAPVPEPGEGEVLVRNVWLSLDPYMRGRMNDVKSYVPPFEVGAVLTGGVVGRVAASRNPKFREGDWVNGLLGWENWSVTGGQGLYKLPSL